MAGQLAGVADRLAFRGFPEVGMADLRVACRTACWGVECTLAECRAAAGWDMAAVSAAYIS
jgi:hypothetical protein